jgi:hypothetical protein
VGGACASLLWCCTDETTPCSLASKRSAVRTSRRTATKTFSLRRSNPDTRPLRYELLVERLESKGEDNEFAEVVPIRQLIKTLRDAEEAAGSKKEVALLERERKRLQGYVRLPRHCHTDWYGC